MSGSYSISEFRPLTFHDAVPRMLAGEDTPRAYLDRCLAVIAAREPTVKAWQSMRIEGAIADADASTARYAAGKPLSSIDGLPFGVKDLIQTFDLPTGLGIEGNEDARSPYDSASIQALRAAGAILVGKVTTTELGGGWPSKTRNPFDEARTPGGSSSGSAAAIGAGMVPVTLGTQVGGSIIRPASYCGNFAIKPTIGALNRGERQGLSQACLGVHAGCLTDMWRVAMEIAKRAGGDPGQPGLYGQDDLIDPVKPLRLAVLEGEGWAVSEPSTIKGFEGILQQLADRGVIILRRSDEPALEALEQAVSGAMMSTAAIVSFENRSLYDNLVRIMPEKLSPGTVSRHEATRDTPLREYRFALAEREAARRRLAALAPLCDAIISPSSTGPAPFIEALGKSAMATGNAAYNCVTSWLGGPALTMPLMQIDGMPVGVQLVGQWHDDERISGMARWIVENIETRALQE